MTDPLVYNAAGEPRSLEWLREKYGPFIIYDPPPLPEGEQALTWNITTLREKLDAPAALVVLCKDLDGEPLAGVKVAWYWPDAPTDAACGPQGAPFDHVTPARAHSSYTNVNGDIGFAMGQGAYYWADRGERGPHAVWIHGTETRSQLILGLGMLAGTNHHHFDVEYTAQVETGGEDPDPDPDEGEFLLLMGQIVEQMTRIADRLDQAYIPTPGAPTDG